MMEGKEIKVCGICGIELSVETCTVDNITCLVNNGINKAYIPRMTEEFHGGYLCCVCEDILREESERVGEIIKKKLLNFVKKQRKNKQKNLGYYKARKVTHLVWSSFTIWAEPLEAKNGGVVIGMPLEEAIQAYPKKQLKVRDVFKTKFSTIGGDNYEYYIIITNEKSPWYNYKKNEPRKQGKAMYGGV
jgi:hypothetical protein